MADEKKPFVPFTPEQKAEYGKQFSKAEKMSYRKGQRSAYSHMANTARRESIFVGDNIKKYGDGLAPLPAQQATAPQPVPATPLKKPYITTPREHDISKIPPGSPLDKVFKAYTSGKKQ